MLTISNVYGHGYDQVQLETLRSLGFKFRGKVSRYAGSQVLYFIDFSEGPALEFIEVENENDYINFLPKGMVAYCPGINLRIPRGSSKSITRFKQVYREWGSNLIHVNYDGSEEPDRPGWNYLNFDTPVVTDTFIYLGVPDNPKPAIDVETNHPNTTKQVIGLVFNLGEQYLVKLADLAGVEVAGGKIKLGGVQIWSSNALAGKIRIPEKKFPLVAIIVQAKSIDFFRDRENIEVFEYLSRPSVYIQTNGLSWDLIVTT